MPVTACTTSAIWKYVNRAMTSLGSDQRSTRFVLHEKLDLGWFKIGRH